MKANAIWRIAILCLFAIPFLFVMEATAIDGEQLYRSFTNEFREAIFDSLKVYCDENRGGGNVVSEERVRLIGHIAASAEYESLFVDTAFVHRKLSDSDRRSLRAVFDEIKALFDAISENLRIDTTLQVGGQVEIFLDKLFLGFPVASQERKDRLSNTLVIIGGSWVHTEDGAAEGKVTAELRLRTRFADSRPKPASQLDRIGRVTAERRFFDLIVDARFLTNSAFTKDSGTNAGAESILTDTKSSVVSVGLFWGAGMFFDGGIVGPLLKFQVSSLEASDRVFRRLMVGMRAENRNTDSRIQNANLELGFTKREEPSNRGKYDFSPNLGRFFVTAEMPLISAGASSVFISFNGEFPLHHDDCYKSLYEFRVAATADPKKLLGTMFRDSK